MMLSWRMSFNPGFYFQKQQIVKIKTFQFYSIETKLFFLFSILNLIPVFLVKYVGSIDAPLHLYQSNVIGELWRSNELFEQFFKFNPIIVGNSTSQFILAFFNFVFPAWIAEKILLTIYILGLAFSFRYLITGINKKFSFISFLIFPFTYNTFFLFGHYNYVFGIFVMLIVFGYWIRIENNLTIYKVLTLCILFILLFLSHMFVYTFFVGSFGLYLLFNLFISLKNQNTRKISFMLFFKKVAFVFLAIIPSLILWFIYGNSISGDIKLDRFSLSTLANDLVNIKPLIGYEYAIEKNENNLLFILLCFLVLYVIINRIFLYRKSNTRINNISGFFSSNDFWFLLSLIFLLFYFIIPDKLTAGNISARLSILLFTFLIIWLSLQQVSKIVSTITLVIIIVYSINIRVVQNKYLSGLDKDIREICELNEYLDSNSVYYPMNFNPNWIMANFLNYVGVNDPFVSAQLPNCSGTFPIIDTRNKLPVVILGNTDLDRFCYWCSNRDKSNPKKDVDYIIIGGATVLSNSNNFINIKTVLLDNYVIVHRSSDRNLELYKLKEK